MNVIELIKKTKTDLLPFEVERKHVTYNEGCNLNLALFPTGNHKFTQMVDTLVHKANEMYPQRSNRKALCDRKDAAAMLLAQLVSNARLNYARHWLSFAMNRRYAGSFPKVSDTARNPLGVSLDTLRQLVEVMAKIGWIELKKGYYWECSGVSRPSRVRIRPRKYLSLFKGAKVWADLDTMQAVRMRDDKKVVIKCKETGKLRTIRQKFDVKIAADERVLDLVDFMNRYNKFRTTYTFEAPFIEDGVAAYDTVKNGKAVHQTRDLENSPCTMIFSRGSLNKNGRIYNNGFQSLPSELRAQTYVRYTDSNGADQLRLMKGKDFGACALSFLAAKNGEALSDKFYRLVNVPGASTKQSETIVKYVLSAAINCDENSNMYQAARSRLNGKVSDLTIKLTNEVIDYIINEFSNKFSWFRSAIKSDKGVELMNFEARVARRVIEQFMNCGIPVEGGHDAFYVPEGYEDELAFFMKMYAREELDVSYDVAYGTIIVEDA